MTARVEPHDARTLLEATRRALVRVSDGLDPSVVLPDTPLAALVFDSLTAANFIATLESDLGVDDLPFERWLAEHSERSDALTIGSLVEWLQSVPDLALRAARRVHDASGGASGNG